MDIPSSSKDSGYWHNLPQGRKLWMGETDLETRSSLLCATVLAMHDADVARAKSLKANESTIQNRVEWLTRRDALDNTARNGFPRDKAIAALAAKSGVNDVKVQKGWLANVKKVQAAIAPKYRIHLFRKCNFVHLEHFYTGEIPEGQPSTPIFLLTNQRGDFDALKAVTNNKREWFCTGCVGFFPHKRRHVCSLWCPRCMSYDGNCDKGLRIDCLDCRNPCGYFRSAECFERHRACKPGGKARCDLMQKCFRCMQVYNLAMGDGRHECGKKFCKRCRAYKPHTHDCHWRPVTDEDRKKAIKKQEELKYGLYDFETSQSYLEIGGDKECSRHEAVGVGIQLCCHLCEHDLDMECANCPERRVWLKRGPSESEMSFIDRFVSYLAGNKHLNGRVFLAHNGGRYDIHLLMAGLLRRGVRPSIAANGSNIIFGKATFRKGRNYHAITFKNSYQLLNMPLSAMPEAYGLSSGDKGHYPFYGTGAEYDGKTRVGLPPKKLYGWYATVPADYHYDYSAELERYCIQDCRILAEAIRKFRQTAISTLKYCPVTHACTIASCDLFLMRYSYVKAEEMPHLKESGMGGKNQSMGGKKAIRWVEHQLGRQVQSWLSPVGEKVIEIFDGGKHHHIYCDMFDPEQGSRGKVIEYHGCRFHGCEDCFPNRTAKSICGSGTVEDDYRKSMEKIEILMKAGYETEVIWECKFLAEAKQNPEMQEFLANVKVPENRLALRKGLRGGRTEAPRFKMLRTPRRKIKYLDVTSMYVVSSVKPDNIF